MRLMNYHCTYVYVYNKLMNYHWVSSSTVPMFMRDFMIRFRVHKDISKECLLTNW